MATVTIHTEVLPTVEAAEARVQMIYQSYHPSGYGTTLRIVPTADGYIVKGYRYDSCD